MELAAKSPRWHGDSTQTGGGEQSLGVPAQPPELQRGLGHREERWEGERWMPEAESWLQGCSRKKLGFPHATRAPRHGDTFLGFTSLPLPLCHPPALQQALAGVPVNTNPQTHGWQDGAQVGNVPAARGLGVPLLPHTECRGALPRALGSHQAGRAAPGGAMGAPRAAPRPPAGLRTESSIVFPPVRVTKGQMDFHEMLLKNEKGLASGPRPRLPSQPQAKFYG